MRAAVLVALGLALAQVCPVVVGAPPGYDCPAFPARTPPTTVSDLRPQDVKVVMAIGDSITAAFAAEGSIIEYRDESWAIGGGANKTTMPGFMGVFSPTLYGMSMYDHLPEVHGMKHEPALDFLNAAQSEARVDDVKGQIEYLITELNSTSRINMADDWKVLTIWIGANDLCKVCTGSGSAAPSVYISTLDAALAQLHASIPRLFVNLVSTLMLSSVANVDRKIAGCDIEHIFITECGCVFKANSTQLQEMDQATVAYNQGLHTLAQKYNRLTPDFGVVSIPMLEGTQIPDESYLSTLDCFHPSLKTHQMLGVGLWNSMLTPNAQKMVGWSGQKLSPICPTADTLLYTQ